MVDDCVVAKVMDELGDSHFDFGNPTRKLCLKDGECAYDEVSKVVVTGASIAAATVTKVAITNTTMTKTTIITTVGEGLATQN